MNLVDGKILDTKDCAAVLDTLDERILSTLSKERLGPETVINACHRLVSELDEGPYIEIMVSLGIGEQLGRRYIDEARRLFSRDSLTLRLKTELGEDYGESVSFVPQGRDYTVTHRTEPLGVLLHVAAGNADGLPAFSVLEGLLTGNINILKLPAQEGGISVRLLSELIRIEPELAEYIYVFDYSSKDIENVGKLISAADAVVVWGGKEAVSALRALVPPHIRLIEWGHKVSFAYVVPGGITPKGLEGLAHNIASTGQLLCSSAQGIFLDSDDMEQVYAFCAMFLPYLERAVAECSFGGDIGIQSQAALRLYASELEGIYSPRRIFRGEGCSLTAYPDSTLDTSIQYGNAWVRPLPRSGIAGALRPYKNYLQTAGLLCPAEEHARLSEALLRAGVVRVCAPRHMSDTYNGAHHDGEYPLRRYTRITSSEIHNS